MNVKKYDWACCELSGYKKGYISIHIDFNSNVLSWKDSNHWYNNFVRGLPSSQIDPVKNSLIKFIKANQDKTETTIDSPQEYVWTIQIGENEETIEYKGYDIQTIEWYELAAAIEKVSRHEFRL